MKIINLKNGFSLIETVIALLIISISGTILMGLQLKMTRSVYTQHAFIERIILMKNMLISVNQKDNINKEKLVIELPETILNYETKNFTNLKLDNLLQEKVAATWPTSFGKELQEEIVSFKLKKLKPNQERQQKSQQALRQQNSSK